MHACTDVVGSLGEDAGRLRWIRVTWETGNYTHAVASQPRVQRMPEHGWMSYVAFFFPLMS